MSDIAGLLKGAIERLAAAGVPDPRREAQLLLSEAAGIDRGAIITAPEREIDREARSRFDDFLVRRENRTPITKILGRTGFWNAELIVSEDVLDPRPDTETIVDAALSLRPDRQTPWRILDLGTGSGCILIALLSEYRNATGLGTDRSRPALEVARANIRGNGLDGRATVCASDWSNAVRSGFDIVVSNPPYIPTDEIATLEPEVTQHDPTSALDGGADGLDCYRMILSDLQRVLGGDGICLLEVGKGQADAVSSIADFHGLVTVGHYNDLAGIARVVAVAHKRDSARG